MHNVDINMIESWIREEIRGLETEATSFQVQQPSIVLVNNASNSTPYLPQVQFIFPFISQSNPLQLSLLLATLLSHSRDKEEENI